MFRVEVEQSSRGILRGCALTPNPLSHEGRGGFLPGEYQGTPCTPTLNTYEE